MFAVVATPWVPVTAVRRRCSAGWPHRAAAIGPARRRTPSVTRTGTRRSPRTALPEWSVSTAHAPARTALGAKAAPWRRSPGAAMKRSPGATSLLSDATPVGTRPAQSGAHSLTGPSRMKVPFSCPRVMARGAAATR